MRRGAFCTAAKTTGTATIAERRDRVGRYATLGTGGDGHRTGGRRARSLAADHVGSGQGGDEGLIACVVLGMLEGGIVRAARQKLFVLCARMVFRVAVGRCDLTMMGLLWLRAARRRSRIFEHALQQNAFRAAALIFHEKYAPTFDKWAAIRHSCFRISLVNASALATIASVVALVPTATFSQAKRKQQKK